MATWLDETLGDVAGRLEQPACELAGGERVKKLLAGQLYTTAWCESGSVYWWGVLPYAQRKVRSQRLTDVIRFVHIFFHIHFEMH